MAYESLRVAKFTIWDDKKNIIDNESFLHPLNKLISECVKPKTIGIKYDMYVPVTHAFWWVVYQVSEKQDENTGHSHPQSRYFHLANFSIHMLTIIMVYLFLEGALRHFWHKNPSPFVPWAGSLFFALHPIQVEPVSWISGTKDLLAGFSVAASLVFYLRYEESRGGFSEWSFHKKVLSQLPSFFLFIMGLLSKPSAVIAPLLMAMTGKIIFRRSWRSLVLMLAPYILISIPLVIGNEIIQNRSSQVSTPFLYRPLVAAEAVFFYLRKILHPIDLCIDYGHRLDLVALGQNEIFTLLVLVVGILLLLKFHRKISGIYFLSLGIFLAGLLPVLGFVSFQFQKKSIVADHYLYVSMIGVSLFVAAVLSQRRTKLVSCSMALLLSMYFVLTHAQAKTWKDDLTLFQHTLVVNPQSVVACVNLGVAYQVRGDNQNALLSYHRALAIDGKNYLALINIGKIYRAFGHSKEARAYFSLARQFHPTKHVPE